MNSVLWQSPTEVSQKVLSDPPPGAGRMWMLVLGAGSHRALVLSSSRKWFQTPQQNRTEKELTREGASSAKQPRALEGGAVLP